MTYPGGAPGGGPGEQPFSFMRRRRQSNSSTYVAIGAVVVALLVVAGGWYWFGSSRAEDASTGLNGMGDGAPTASESATPSAPGDGGPMVPGGAASGVPPIDLPPLSASDVLVREMVSRLSAHPQLARWLVTDELVERFVAAVVSLAGGQSPNEHLEFLAPEQDFPVQPSGSAVALDPVGYARFNLFVETFLSLDTAGAAQLYHQLHPLFVEAYAELGIPGRSFDEAMALAVANVLAARLPEGPFDLQLVEDRYEFRDPTIEAFSDAEKHLIRMGPANAQRVQDKVEALADRIRLPGY